MEAWRSGSAVPLREATSAALPYTRRAGFLVVPESTRPVHPRSTQFLLFPPKPTIGSWTIGGPVGPQKPMFSLMISMVFHSAHISTSLGDRGSHWGSDQSSFGGSRMHSQALRFSPKSTSETSPKSTSESCTLNPRTFVLQGDLCTKLLELELCLVPHSRGRLRMTGFGSHSETRILRGTLSLRASCLTCRLQPIFDSE